MSSGFSVAPRVFATVYGHLQPTSQSQALFSLLGTQYGGNGTVTCGLPDLRGRTPRGISQSEPVGVASGIESVALTSSQVPSHTHAFAGTAAAANARSAQDSLYAASSANLYAQPDAQVTLAGSTVQDSGSGSPHDNMQPYRTLNFCVALAGVFPSRN